MLPLKWTSSKASGAGREASRGRLLRGFLQLRKLRPSPRRGAARVRALLAVKNHAKVDPSRPASEAIVLVYFRGSTIGGHKVRIFLGGEGGLGVRSARGEEVRVRYPERRSGEMSREMG